MRVSDSHRQSLILHQLASGARAIHDAMQQATTGQRATRLSDDPLHGRQVVELDSARRAMRQYLANAGAIRHRLATEEGVTNQVTDLVSRARELATGQAGSSANASTRVMTAMEVTQLRQQVIALGNTQVNGEFLFGGMATGAPPFQPDGAYLGTPFSRQAELGPGVLADTVHSGQELLVDSGVLAALTALENALMADDTSAILASMSALNGAFDVVQQRLAEVGARDRGLELTEANLTTRLDGMAARRSALADITLEEAVLNLSTAQTALEAAYLTTSRTLSLSLMEYLR